MPGTIFVVHFRRYYSEETLKKNKKNALLNIMKRMSSQFHIPVEEQEWILAKFTGSSIETAKFETLTKIPNPEVSEVSRYA